LGSRALYRLALRNGLLVLLLTGFTGAVRFGLRDVLLSLQNKPRQTLTRVAIYGAGSAGVQLAAALERFRSPASGWSEFQWRK
jgi:FlaA1/EpsC-like NDP-sugar epimerase